MGRSQPIFKNILFVTALYLVLSAFSNSAFAQSNLIRVTGISGTSNYKIGSATVAPVIFAGIAGNDCSADVNNSTTSTCNSCVTAGDMTACNPKRIHPSLVLNVSFTIIGDLTGQIYAFVKPDTGSIGTLNNFTRSTAGTIGKNSTASISISWGNLCSQLAAGACDTPKSEGSIYICILTNGTYDASKCIEIKTPVWSPTDTNPLDCSTRPSNYAVCRFDAVPGDQKITVKELDITTTNNQTVPAKNMVVLLSEVGFDDIDQTTIIDGIAAELTVDSAGDVTPPTVDGLTNGTTYFVKSAVMDMANNLYYITSDAEITNYCTSLTGNDPSTAVAGDDFTCKYIATPDEVYGLLTEDFNCFITTAAYGSGFAAKVNDFRAFRNRFLVPSQLGRKIIFYYYDVGPKAARWIGEHAWVKPVVRAALFPAWLFVQTASVLGLTAAIVFFISFFTLLICGIYILRTSHQRRATV